MPFMQPETAYQGMWHVETDSGTETIPHELVGGDVYHPPEPSDMRPYLESPAYIRTDGWPDASLHEGWYARLSAPGFLDATDWTGPYATESDAIAALAKMHDICPRCWETCWDGPDGECGEDDDA